MSQGWSTGTETKQKRKRVGRWHRLRGGGLGQVAGMGLALWVKLAVEGAISLYRVSPFSPLAGPGRWGPAHCRRSPEDAAR